MQNKKAQNPAKKIPVTLSKEEIKAIKKRMAEIKKYANDESTTQNTISYQQMFKDGTCALGGGKYSRTVQFFDADYSLAEFEQQDNIVTKYCDLLNSFDSSVSFQLTFENQNRSLKKLIKEITLPPQEDSFNDLREEYSQMLKDKLELGSNGLDTKKFITFTVEAKNIREARNKLSNIQCEIIRYFKNFGVKSKGLTGEERLETIYYSLHPFTDKPFLYDFNLAVRMGWNDKDFIAPTSLKFNKSDFEIGSAFGSISNFNILAGELPDDILKEFMELSQLVCMNIHVKPFDQAAALKFIKLKLSDVERMKIDEQKKASKAGYDPDILPPNIKLYIENLEDLLEKLNTKNERLFTISISLRGYAKTKKQLSLLNDMLKGICQKDNCILMPCEFTQEDELNTSLPIGNNFSQVSREMHTSGIAIFVPFTTKNLFQTGSSAAYYGINPLSGNMIRADRKTLKNPNGLILGTPGSGKSFTVKREIVDDFLGTDDDIIICDPEGEYYPLVNQFGGQIIKISSSSDQYINPMDINLSKDFDENPISVKSEFIVSLCEIIVGGRYGLTAEERSVIDRCVGDIYRQFFENNPTKEKMPTLSDLHKALQKQGEIAERVANSLEMYVNGSQKLFNNRTNIDLNNRTVCFDIKDLGSQLKKVGMLIVQDAVWNRVSLNRAEKKSTRYYMDEFHLLLKEEQTAKYSAEIWKRFRKWGGIPTGITQNVKDLLMSQEVENIFDNSDFVVMLNQAAGDREILAEKLHIPPEKQEYITNASQGCGLISFGEYMLPFEDKFPKNTKLYKLMTTKLEEQ